MFIAENIRALRRKAGYSQNELASMLGYNTFTTIQKWESGVSTPPLGTFAKLAEIFGVSMDDLAKKDLTGDSHVYDESASAFAEFSDGDYIVFEKPGDTDLDPDARYDKAALRQIRILNGNYTFRPATEEPSLFELVGIIRILRKKQL